VILGIIVFFVLLGLWMHDYGSQYLEKLLYILRKRPSSYIPLLILIFILFWYEYRFHLPYISTLLFIPHELNISDEILDILTPAILLFLSSFYIFQVLLVKVRGFGAKSNLNKNISLLNKSITILIAVVFFPMVKSFVGSSINTTIIGIVGYSSEYFPYFENVVLSICLILQFVFVIFLMNILFMYSYFIVSSKYFINWSSWLRFFIFLSVIGNNIYLTWIVVDRIQFILSENGDSKEIRELLLVTSYNEIPNRCNLLLNSYGRKENALLAFIDKDSVSLYIIKENKFINESCR
jgi:hypothetical protein